MAMAAWTAAARQATNLSRLSSRQCTEAVNLMQRRGLSGGGGDPLNPSRWTEEHFVIASLSGWGLLFYGGYKMFSGGKKDSKEEKVEEKSK